MQVKKQDYQQLLWDFIGIAWRRKFWVLIPLAIGTVVSVYLVFSLPKIYQSSTLILVEEQKVPQSIVQSAVTGTAQDRLTSIKQQVLSRSFLLRIIEKFGLYQAGEPSFTQKMLAKVGIEVNPMTTDAKIEAMRKNVEVRTRGGSRLESFSISFMGREPVTVMNVTNELSSLVIEENLRIREGFIEGATDFLVVELENLKKELERQEQRFGDYKRANMGELPEQLDSNLRALDRFQVNLETIRLSKKAAHDRIAELERSYKILSQQKKQMSTDGVVSTDSIQGLDLLTSSPLEQRLTQSRVMLADLLIEYNDNYPDVIVLKGKIRELEKKLENSREEEGNNPKPVDRGPAPISRIGVDSTLSLVAQIRDANNDLKDFEKREAELETQIKLFEQRVENTPRREQEMVTIQRDYENISRSYQTLLEKKLNAEISENLEKRQKGEQFRIIDPASLPERPIKPNKLLVLILGGGLSLGFGVALAFLREQLDNSVRKPEEVERITSVLVLAVIPDFEDEIQQGEVQKGQKVVDIEQFSGRRRTIGGGGNQ